MGCSFRSALKNPLLLILWMVLSPSKFVEDAMIPLVYATPNNRSVMTCQSKQNFNAFTQGSPLQMRMHGNTEPNVEFKSDNGLLPYVSPERESINLTDIGLNGTLRVTVTFTEYEATYKAVLSNGTTVNLYGSANIAYAVLLDLQEIFNFSLVIMESGGWITPGLNDTITGAGYQIASGHADISIDLSKPTPYRAKHLDFLHAFKQDRVAIMFRQPKVQLYRNILSRPFRNGLWKCFLGCWLLIFVSTTVIAWKALTICDFKEVILSIIATSMTRAVSMDVILERCRNTSLRMVILVASIFGLTMYSIYSAFIVSSLRRAEAPIRKFQHLFEYEYELLAQRSLPDFTNVFVHDAKVGNSLAEVARDNFISVEDSLERLFLPLANRRYWYDERDDNPNVAWFALKTDFYYMALQHGYTTRQICQISQMNPAVKEEHPRLLSMFIGKNNSKLKEHFNRRILDILERGLAYRHVQQYEYKFQPKCDSLRRRLNLSRIRFYDVYAAYAILTGGAATAVAIWMFGEILLPYILRTFTIRNTRYRVQEFQTSNHAITNVKTAEWNVPKIVLSKSELSDGDDDDILVCELD